MMGNQSAPKLDPVAPPFGGEQCVIVRWSQSCLKVAVGSPLQAVCFNFFRRFPQSIHVGSQRVCSVCVDGWVGRCVGVCVGVGVVGVDVGVVWVWVWVWVGMWV